MFSAKLEESKVGLVEALRQKPGWSKLRWVNVNGIEKSTLFSIIKEFKLDIEATSYMFTSHDNCNVDTYDNDQLFCELCVLHCFENVSNIEQSELPLGREKTILVKRVDRAVPNVTTYLKEKSKMKLFDPDEERRYLTVGTELLKKQKEFEKSKLLKTLNYSIAIERGWLFITDSGTVISFFENTGEEVEEKVLFDFIKSLHSKGRMETDEFTCLENILDAFIFNMRPLVTLYQNLLYRFKVDLNTDASTKRLHQLYLMIDELTALKLRLGRLVKMINVLLNNFTMPCDCKRYMLNLKETLEELTGETREMMESIKNLIDLTFNRVSASTSKYMSLLAFVSMIFLPMSFLAGYFGMNYFSNLHHVGVFWTIACVVTVGTIGIVCFVFYFDCPNILNLLYKLVSNSYNYLLEKTAEFKQKMKKQKHEDIESRVCFTSSRC
ncbi:unnamed protein product [Ambrosiozyma monospora]|uniref:Unnamed protein product n=1 Tax=Ambrosiozyma monospora TaxID=43982 RepID=A0A9W6Z143_AMBMO|nr:unnamed protein product [Ambrosiozyma monospora]